MMQVINSEVTQYKLPKVGTLKDGRTVSGYHLLDEEILREEGWLPLEDIQPEYDEETQYLIHDGYEILVDKVIKKYKVEDIPEPQEPKPSEIDLLKDENEKLKIKLHLLEQTTTETSLSQQELVELLIEMGAI